MKNSTLFRTLISVALCAAMLLSLAITAAADGFYDYCTDGIIPGDANSDEVANILDAIAIVRLAAGFDESIDKACADVNRDDTVNVLDAIIISKYVLGYKDIRLCHRGAEETVPGESCLSPLTVRFVCELCDYKDEYKTAAPGHDYARGECTSCGEQGADYGFYKTVDWIKANDEMDEILAEEGMDELLGMMEDLPGCYAVTLSEEVDESGLYGTAEIVMYMDTVEFMGSLGELTSEDLEMMEGMTDAISFSKVDVTESTMEIFSAQIMPMNLTDPELMGVTVSYMEMNESGGIYADGVIYGDEYTEYLYAYTLDEEFNDTTLSDGETAALKDKIYAMTNNFAVKLDERYTESTGEDFSPDWLGIGYGSMTGFDGIARWIRTNDQYEEILADEELSNIFYYAEEFGHQGIYAVVLENLTDEEGTVTDRTVAVYVDAEEFMTSLESPDTTVGPDCDLVDKGDLITILSWKDHGTKKDGDIVLELNKEYTELEFFSSSVTGTDPEGIELWYSCTFDSDELRPEWLELGMPVRAFVEGTVFGSGEEELEIYVNDSEDTDLPADNYKDQLSEEQLGMFIDDIHAGVYEIIGLLGEGYSASYGLEFSPSWLGCTACGGDPDAAHEFAAGVCVNCAEPDPAVIGELAVPAIAD